MTYSVSSRDRISSKGGEVGGIGLKSHDLLIFAPPLLLPEASNLPDVHVVVVHELLLNKVLQMFFVLEASLGSEMHLSD